MTQKKIFLNSIDINYFMLGWLLVICVEVVNVAIILNALRRDNINRKTDTGCINKDLLCVFKSVFVLFSYFSYPILVSKFSVSNRNLNINSPKVSMLNICILLSLLSLFILSNLISFNLISNTFSLLLF